MQSLSQTLSSSLSPIAAAADPTTPRLAAGRLVDPASWFRQQGSAGLRWRPSLLLVGPLLLPVGKNQIQNKIITYRQAN